MLQGVGNVMKMKLKFIEDFSVLSDDDLCDKCSKLDVNKDGICSSCYSNNFTKLLHPDMVEFVKKNREINIHINNLFWVLNDTMSDILCDKCSLKDLSKKDGNDLCDICYIKETAFLFTREAVSRNNDINKLLEYGENMVSAHSSFSLFRCFIELFCLYFVVITDTPTARSYEVDDGRGKGFIRNHPQIQQAAIKHKGNFNFKKPGERELRFLAGEILSGLQYHSHHKHQKFNIDLLYQQYNDFCLFNHTSMKGMIFWGNQFDNDKEIKTVAKQVLADVNCFAMMILSNALSVCLNNSKLSEIEKDILSLCDKINTQLADSV